MESLGRHLAHCLAVRDHRGRPAVLKLPLRPEQGRREGRALWLWAGHGVPSIFQADLHNGVLLMERVLPGRPPKTRAECTPERLSTALARLYARRAPCPADFPSMADRIRELVRWRTDYLTWKGQPPETRSWRRALLAADRLCASASEQILLHGDFQRKNIVVDGAGELVVIDPLPCIGERAFDVALTALTSRSGMPISAFVERMNRTIKCDPQRVLKWVPVLSATIGPEHRGD
jgi:streptomycin 6-kinase